MRICLLTGGGYPFRRDALGGWCRTVVEGLPEITFDLLTVVDREPAGGLAYPLPRNVRSASAIAPHLPEPRRAGAPDDGAVAAAVLLCRGLLGEQLNADHMFADGLSRLATMIDPPSSALPPSTRPKGGRSDAAPSPLAGVALADVLLDAWRTGQLMTANDRLPLPRLSVRDARTAATLLRHALRTLAVEPTRADLVHCVGGTTPLLAALAGRWRSGTPLLLTEARAPVARLRPAEERLSPAVRTVLRRFRRAVARTGYAEASLIAPLSAYHHGWALKHGATPSRLVSVPAGADPVDAAADPAPSLSSSEPALVWAGSGGPDSGLTHLLDAFGGVVTQVPGTVLHLVGVTAAHVDHAAEEIERSGLGRAVRLHPLPDDDRYAAGHVIVHLPGPADPPYRLVEAMMSGRAVVGVDIGPAAETLGDTGVLVKPDDPADLARAIVALLRAPARRRALGEAARRRALAHFTTDRVLRVYRALYTDLAAPPPPPSFELALSVPAPRTELPATMRWLVREDS